MPFEPRQEEIALAKADRPYWRTHQWKYPDIVWIPKTRSTEWSRGVCVTPAFAAESWNAWSTWPRATFGGFRWSTLQNLEPTVQGFRDALNAGIQQATQTTRCAIEAARRRRTEDSATVISGLNRR